MLSRITFPNSSSSLCDIATTSAANILSESRTSKTLRAPFTHFASNLLTLTLRLYIPHHLRRNTLWHPKIVLLMKMMTVGMLCLRLRSTSAVTAHYPLTTSQSSLRRRVRSLRQGISTMSLWISGKNIICFITLRSKE